MLDTVKTYLRYTSWPIIMAMIALVVIGVSAIRVSEQAEGLEGYASKQTMFAMVALGAFVAATVVPYAKVGRVAYAMFAATMVLLVVVLRLRPVHGSYRWIDIGIVQVQVSEIAKISYIIMLAWYLRFRDNYRNLSGLMLPFLLTLAPMVLVLVEPDLGTSLLFLPTLYFMLFLAGARLGHLLVILGLGAVLVLVPMPRGVEAVAFERDKDRFTSRRLGPVTFYKIDPGLDPSQRPRTPVAYCRYRIGDGGAYDLQPLSLRLLKGHQIDRVEGWLRQDEPNIARGIGYQLHQAKMILGAGSWTGRRGWNDAEGYFSLLPEDHTDFILAVVGGQWGLLGCLALLFLYGVIFVLGVEIAVITDDPFGRLLAVGVLALLFTQLVINAGMAMGMMPVTGMTLPLVSYGGSSLVINCAALGLLVNVGQRRTIRLAPKPFEYTPRERPSPLA